MNKKHLTPTAIVYLVITALCLIFEFSKVSIASFLLVHFPPGDTLPFWLGLFSLFMNFAYLLIIFSTIIYIPIALSKLKWRALQPLAIVAVAVLIYIVASACGAISPDAKSAHQREILNNAHRLEAHILDTATEYSVIPLSRLAPFEWDTMYSFAPYTAVEDIYETVGYRWDFISRSYSEGVMQLVFMKEDTVVCYVYGGHSHGEHFSLFCDKTELRLSDNPLFIITRIPTGYEVDAYNGYVSLSLFDQSPDLLAKAVAPPPDMVGQWRNSEEQDFGKHLDFIITKEGIVSGTYGFNGSGFAFNDPFVGIYMDGTLHCQVTQETDASAVPPVFDILFANGQFTLSFDTGNPSNTPLSSLIATKYK